MPENKTDYQAKITAYIENIQVNFTALYELHKPIASAANLMITALAKQNCIFFCGNGGSAGDAQHLAAELVGRYRKERDAMAAIALTVDTSALTAIGNDYGFEQIFARQLAGLARKDDVLYAISTSGNSPNILEAIQVARNKQLVVIGVTGANGGKMLGLCDVMIQAPSLETNHIQEMHIAIGHMLCGFIEDTQ